MSPAIQRLLTSPQCLQNICRLRGTEVPAIITIMRRVKTLEEIYLDGNNFIDEDYMTLLQGLMKTNKMKIVSLGLHTWISKETANVSIRSSMSWDSDGQFTVFAGYYSAE